MIEQAVKQGGREEEEDNNNLERGEGEERDYSALAKNDLKERIQEEGKMHSYLIEQF
jgi:hypothetical protein